MVDVNLSLTAELILLAIDPEKGGLFPRRRRRFRKALAATDIAGRGDARMGVWGARRARRRALGELERAGLVEERRLFGRLRLADRTRARERFSELVRCVREDELDPRDRELLLLLAWSGVLVRRLSRDERRLAVRRLRKWVPSAEAAGGWQARLRGQASISGVGVVGLAAGAGFDFGGCEAVFGGGSGGGGAGGGGGDGGGYGGGFGAGDGGGGGGGGGGCP